MLLLRVADAFSGRRDLGGTLLATPTSRTRWASAHLAVALAATVILQTALGLGVGAGAALGSPASELARAFSLALRVTPAIWVIIGVTTLAFRIFRRWTPWWPGQP